jgi:hypothetical protein
MKQANSVWAQEISCEFRAATNIAAAVTRPKARSLMRKGQGNSLALRSKDSRGIFVGNQSDCRMQTRTPKAAASEVFFARENALFIVLVLLDD